MRIVPRRRRRWTLIPVLALAGVMAASGVASAAPRAGHAGARPQERLASASQCADLMLWLTGSAPGAPGTSYAGYMSLLFFDPRGHQILAAAAISLLIGVVIMRSMMRWALR